MSNLVNIIGNEPNMILSEALKPISKGGALGTRIWRSGSDSQRSPILNLILIPWLRGKVRKAWTLSDNHLQPKMEGDYWRCSSKIQANQDSRRFLCIPSEKQLPRHLLNPKIVYLVLSEPNIELLKQYWTQAKNFWFEFHSTKQLPQNGVKRLESYVETTLAEELKQVLEVGSSRSNSIF